MLPESKRLALCPTGLHVTYDYGLPSRDLRSQNKKRVTQSITHHHWSHKHNMSFSTLLSLAFAVGVGGALYVNFDRMTNYIAQTRECATILLRVRRRPKYIHTY